MNLLDPSLLGFGLFMLACGLVPALLAWRQERRPPAAPWTGTLVSVIFHEPVRPTAGGMPRLFLGTPMGTPMGTPVATH